MIKVYAFGADKRMEEPIDVYDAEYRVCDEDLERAGCLSADAWARHQRGEPIRLPYTPPTR